MAKIKVEYLGDLRTRAIHIRSGNDLLTDAPTDNKGKGEFFSPTDLTVTSLLTCMLTVMGILAREKKIAFKVEESWADKIMTSNPRRIERIEIGIVIKEEGQSEKEKKMLQEVAENCPVALSLSSDLKQETHITYR